MHSKHFLKALRRIGKPVIIRKNIGSSWVDSNSTADIQKVGLKHEVVSAGLLEAGDAVGYFMPSIDIDVGDRVIQDAEFIVDQVGRKQIGDETVYIKALLKRVNDSVQADFYGSNRVFFDDFAENREAWTEKSGSWSIVNEQYCGVAADVYSVAESVAGDEAWKDYVVIAKVTVESGNAGLKFRFTSSGVERFYEAVLRIDEGLFALEKYDGSDWMRLESVEANLQLNQEYTVRIHCFGSYLMLFLDGSFMFTVNDSSFKNGMLGCEALGGTVYFDDVEVYS